MDAFQFMTDTFSLLTATRHNLVILAVQLPWPLEISTVSPLFGASQLKQFCSDPCFAETSHVGKETETRWHCKVV